MHFYLQFFNSIFLWYTHSTDQEMNRLIISDENETFIQQLKNWILWKLIASFLSITIIVGIIFTI